MRSSGTHIICRSVESRRGRESPLGDPVRVHGATASAQAYLTSQLAKLSAPILVICAGEDQANGFASDLEAFGTPSQELTTWEQSPYSSIALSIRTRIDRTAILNSLIQRTNSVIVTTIPALCQATCPRDFFIAHSLHLEVGAALDSREQLILKLLENGYLRVDPVEDPGTFAVRGDIIDIFPIGQNQPVRIELFDDEIERIRNFDPATQRASNERPSAEIPPAREVLVNNETAPKIRENLKARADDAGISRAVRDPIFSSVQSGNYPDHSDAWGGFAFEAPATAWDYLPENISVIWVDEHGALEAWKDFLADQEKREPEMEQNGIIIPSVHQVYRWDDSLEKKVRAKSDLYLDRLELTSAAEISEEAAPSSDQLSSKHSVVIQGNADLAAGGKRDAAQVFSELEKKFKLWIKQGFKIQAYASTQSQLERIRFILEERGITALTDESAHVQLKFGSLSEGFRWPAEGLVVLGEGELLGSQRSRKRMRSGVESGSAAKDWSGLQALSDLGVGDAVVHIDHGIGRYRGLVRLSLSGAPSDFLLLEYANKDKLYLPVYRLNVIQKYVGASEGLQLDQLGGQQFAKAKDKVREEVKKLAIDLVQLYAERKIRPGYSFSPCDALFREFEAKFPFEETPDQLKAIDQVLGDLESGRVMDRLVCGDVGYGKTEVAIRAAFRAVSDGKQVAVLVPTTVLAFQHEQSFKTRMKDYPIQIESVSRFKTAKEQKTVLENLKGGKVDILIGTHRLLSKDIHFENLGLIIVDEEHRFGVEHKEKLKTLKTNTHVLTLTATPIPRTLHMALSGIRDISLINTPPVDRLPIRTYVSKFEEELIQRAIRTELNRGGQVFFLHNRVQSIQDIAKKVRELCPEAAVGIGHGQMSEGELESAMLDFYQRKTNVLVCTTIIESGLDVPNANTIVIDRADTLGLAQLYQIRGRVGRGQQRAYAYLMIPPESAITGDAKRRLEVIQRFVELGSGFSVASHDLEIRGGGDLLGARQSGHIAAVGFDLYMELLEEAIRELRKKPGVLSEEARTTTREPEIKAPFPAFLPEEYVPDIHQRLSLYRRFSASNEENEVTRLEEELRDRFGPLPDPAQNLLWMIRIKQILKKTGIDTLTVGPEKVSLVINTESRIDPARTIGLVAGNSALYQLTPDSKLVAKIPTGSLRDLFFALEKLFKGLVAA